MVTEQGNIGRYLLQVPGNAKIKDSTDPTGAALRTRGIAVTQNINFQWELDVGALRERCPTEGVSR
ncbi:hypothetical protein M404DRAFT_992176 [Pisolithus tinctorius Marx 270]|uniref:Uncharacterized protein n=1 Tax=Pisolithus tinctorius Marx 270 TaxID=870435 RepID=A0A0C3KWN4_PISTI|nr:hypothetical protein M404DRAFT_992176 [Pisolithus tinctorius Marx 270]